MPNTSTTPLLLLELQAFIEAVDACDNGVNQWASPDPPKYLNNTHLGARVSRLNPRYCCGFADAFGAPFRQKLRHKNVVKPVYEQVERRIY